MNRHRSAALLGLVAILAGLALAATVYAAERREDPPMHRWVHPLVCVEAQAPGWPIAAALQRLDGLPVKLAHLDSCIGEPQRITIRSGRYDATWYGLAVPRVRNDRWFVHVEISLNNARPSDPVERLSTTVHELLHALGLTHSPHRASGMDPHRDRGSLIGPTAYDRARLAELYGEHR